MGTLWPRIVARREISGMLGKTMLRCFASASHKPNCNLLNSGESELDCWSNDLPVANQWVGIAFQTI